MIELEETFLYVHRLLEIVTVKLLDTLTADGMKLVPVVTIPDRVEVPDPWMTAKA